ncbi:hypothetical protein [Litorihabitans aurantiacus]|uniref:LPXTG-motif cell wall anchor domain-containing protein n=1 Tax=Litorihabitans aurantiacus TaxID=1930061 RepID=A0AA37XDP1_9MICO|nr:hypothetical protein [Litorihabitans aurantiacus]GMA30377.1 hypothetical protein GCM10025875_03690 [Litorihabitans aurantiacus]
MKRSLAVGAAAFALVALPAAAQAYPAPPANVAVSSTAPAVGEAVTTSASGLELATEATLTVTSAEENIPDSAIQIAGTASLTKPVPGSTVEFSTTHTVDGTYTHKITTDYGHDIPAQVLTVGNPGGAGGGTGGGTGGGAGSGTGGSTGGGLAETGASVAGLAGLATGLVAVGAGGTYLVRRGARGRA